VVSDHFLATNNTDRVTESREFRGRGIRVSFVHVPGCLSVLDQVLALLVEGSHRHVDISYDVQWETVTNQNDHKEHEVGHELDKVCDQIQIEQQHGLVLPGFLAPHVDRVEHIFPERRQQACREQSVLSFNTGIVED